MIPKPDKRPPHFLNRSLTSFSNLMTGPRTANPKRCAMKRNLLDQPGLQNPLSQNPGTDYDELLDPVFTEGATVLEGEDVRRPGADPAKPETPAKGSDVIDPANPDPQKRGT
jgi:hypothetical protein